MIIMLYIIIILHGASLVAQMVKSLPAVWETQVRSLGQEDPQEKEMATHSSTLAWEIPWTEEPGGLQSIGSQRFRHNWATSQQQKQTKSSLTGTAARGFSLASSPSSHVPLLFPSVPLSPNSADSRIKKIEIWWFSRPVWILQWLAIALQIKF